VNLIVLERYVLIVQSAPQPYMIIKQVYDCATNVNSVWDTSVQNSLFPGHFTICIWFLC